MGAFFLIAYSRETKMLTNLLFYKKIVKSLRCFIQ